jgi:hypothetical protein
VQLLLYARNSGKGTGSCSRLAALGIVEELGDLLALACRFAANSKPTSQSIRLRRGTIGWASSNVNFELGIR